MDEDDDAFCEQLQRQSMNLAHLLLWDIVLVEYNLLFGLNGLDEFLFVWLLSCDKYVGCED